MGLIRNQLADLLKPVPQADAPRSSFEAGLDPAPRTESAATGRNQHLHPHPHHAMTTVERALREQELETLAI